MPRYVQVQNQAGDWELIEVGDRPRGQPRMQIIGAKAHENYVSPIDGTVITSKRQEAEHMREHNVVRPGDFGNNEGKAFFDRERQAKQDFYDGKSPEHKADVKQEVAKAEQMLREGYKPKQQEHTDG